MAEVLIEGRRLDVMDGLDFSFNYSVADVRDPNKRSTSFSKTIKCPSTPSNDELFGHVWSVNISNPNNPSDTNIGANFNPNKKASATVIADGVTVMEGVVQLREITVNNGRYDYNVVFIGKLKNIFSEIGEKQLNGKDDNGNVYIDFSDLDHFLTATTVVNSWQNTTGYTYPLIDYGLSTNYDSQNRRIYDIEDFRPAVFLKTIVDKIFNFAGFTYTSTFMNSAPFTKLIVPWYKQEFTLTDDQIAERQFTAESTADQDIFAFADTVQINNVNYTYGRLEFDDLNDPNNLWNDTTYEFECNDIGYYSFYANQSFTITKINASVITGVVPCILVIKRLSNSVETIVDMVNFDVDIPIGGIGTSETTNIQWSSQQQLCFVGDTVWAELYIETTQFNVVDGSGAFTFTMDDESQFFNQVTEQDIFENSEVYMNNFVPDLTMKELLLSVFKMFNLYITINPEDDTNLIIETRDEYYAGGTIRDWSKKLARNRPITIKPLGLLTAKDYIYTYEEDEDYYNNRYQEARGYAYGRRKREIDNDFLSNTNDVTISFSPTPLANDDVTNRIIAKIYDADSDSGIKPTDINARVLYFQGSLASTPAWVFRYNGGNTSDIKLSYPYAGHLDNPLTPTLDLNFGIPNELYYSANGYTGTLQYTNANLFNVYHRAYINEITNKDSKVMTGEFYLTPFDIQKLDFRDQILIDNSYWRLNKVSDYNPFKEELTKVELIKVIDIVPQKFETFNIGVEGAAGDESYPVNDRNSKLNRNQFKSLSGMVNGKLNRIDPTATAFKVIGDGNFIGANSKNVTILGNNNEVFAGVSNVVIINSHNYQVAEDNITIIDGQRTWRYVDATANVTAQDRQFILADATSGAFTVTLPTIADATNMWVNVKKVDSTLNAITIDPNNVSVTIDGNSTITLNTQYDAVDLYSDGSNWYIR